MSVSATRPWNVHVGWPDEVRIQECLCCFSLGHCSNLCHNIITLMGRFEFLSHPFSYFSRIATSQHGSLEAIPVW